jgi:hypothetical protein
MIPLKTRFLLLLAGFLFCHAFFALHKAALGFDFTDEGVHLSWPMGLLFGEKLFAREIGTLIRLCQLVPFLILKLHPSTTLYEFRLVGWALHLAAFSALSLCLFRLSRAPLLSLLVPSVPFFASNTLTLIVPSYDPTSSDLLVGFFSLRMLAVFSDPPRRLWLNALAGGALFLAVLCYPPLLAITGLVFIIDIIDLCRSRPKAAPWTRAGASNLASLFTYALCGGGFGGYLIFSGALARWQERIPLVRSFALTSLHQNPFEFYAGLAGFFFTHSQFFLLVSLSALLVLPVMIVVRRLYPGWEWRYLTHGFAVLSLAGLSVVYFCDYDYLASFFSLTGIALTGLYLGIGGENCDEREGALKLCVLLSAVASLIYSTSTTFYTAYFSLKIGALGLPFCYSVSLIRLVNPRGIKFSFSAVYMPILLGAAVLELGNFYYHSVYRDASPPQLTAVFSIPKLQQVKSTPERVRGVEELYYYMKPRIRYGEPLLVYDDCPVLYYLLDAKPAYGLTWARQNDISPATLQTLAAEFASQPMPRYAIRTVVDVSKNDWPHAARMRYEHYPLNDTVMANYELEKTIFPFEVWRLKPGKE